MYATTESFADEPQTSSPDQDALYKDCLARAATLPRHAIAAADALTTDVVLSALFS
jgi:hypothetical protein